MPIFHGVEVTNRRHHHPEALFSKVCRKKRLKWGKRHTVDSVISPMAVIAASTSNESYGDLNQFEVVFRKLLCKVWVVLQTWFRHVHAMQPCMRGVVTSINLQPFTASNPRTSTHQSPATCSFQWTFRRETNSGSRTASHQNSRHLCSNLMIQHGVLPNHTPTHFHFHFRPSESETTVL